MTFWGRSKCCWGAISSTPRRKAAGVRVKLIKPGPAIWQSAIKAPSPFSKRSRSKVKTASCNFWAIWRGFCCNFLAKPIAALHW